MTFDASPLCGPLSAGGAQAAATPVSQRDCEAAVAAGDAAAPADRHAAALAASAHRGHLLRFARRHLRDAALAEDVVQEVLTAVLSGQARFGGHSSERTWLTAVLKHKIVDAVRRAGAQGVRFEEPEGDRWAADEAGMGAAGLDPALVVEQRQLLGAVLRRVPSLPATQRVAFELSVLMERSTAEVCAALAITPANLWVRLHRARRALGAPA